MVKIIADELEVCIDCTMAIANGEGPDGHGELMAAQWGDDTMGLVLTCDDDCDGWFSHRNCDGCGSQLAGDRHPAAVLR